MIVKFENLELNVVENKQHEWLLSTDLVAKGYGTSDSNIRKHKTSRPKELIENKHFISVTNSNGGDPQTYWTKRGVVRLGFFIRSESARLFRDWAEDLVINKIAVTPINDVMFFIDGAARILNLNENSKLLMLHQAAEMYNLPQKLLPSYTKSKSILRPLTELLKETPLSAKKANIILAKKGVIEQKKRNSTHGEKCFWSINPAYHYLGENLVNPNNPRETQPCWYENKKTEIINILNS